MDIEEAKGQEIAKLQNALQDMQTQLHEAHAAIIQERESAKLAIEQAPPVIKEVPVIDNTKVEQLTNQNHELEVTSSSSSYYTACQEDSIFIQGYQPLVDNCPL